MNLLVQKAGEITHAARVAMEHVKDLQEIELHMNGKLEFPLTEDQQSKLDRYQHIYNARLSGKYLQKDIVNQVKTLFGVSISQAYRDVESAQELFSKVVNVRKQFELNVMLQLNSDYQRKCVELGDMKSLAKFEKNRENILKQVEEIEDNKGELFEGHIYELTFDPSLLGGTPITSTEMKSLLDEINAKRQKKIRTDLFEDIEFEEK